MLCGELPLKKETRCHVTVKAYSTSAEVLDVIYLACNQNPGGVKRLSRGHHHGNGYSSAKPQPTEQLGTKSAPSLFRSAMKTFSSFRSAITQETKAAGAASPHLAAALQVPSRAGVPPRTGRGSRLTVLRRLPLGVQGASVLGTRARARSRPSLHRPSFQRRCCRPANQRGAWGSRVSPTRPRGALRFRGVRSWCEDAAPAAPAAPGRAAPPRASGSPRAQALSVSVLFFSVSTLTSFTFLFFFFFPSPLLSCILFLQKQTQGAPSGRRVRPGELFLCLVVAVAAAARRAASRRPRSSSSRGGERAAMLRPPAGDPSPPALRMPSCPVAQVPGWRYARLRGSPGASCA